MGRRVPQESLVPGVIRDSALVGSTAEMLKSVRPSSYVSKGTRDALDGGRGGEEDCALHHSMMRRRGKMREAHPAVHPESPRPAWR